MLRDGFDDIWEMPVGVKLLWMAIKVRKEQVDKRKGIRMAGGRNIVLDSGAGVLRSREQRNGNGNMIPFKLNYPPFIINNLILKMNTTLKKRTLSNVSNKSIKAVSSNRSLKSKGKVKNSMQTEASKSKEKSETKKKKK